MTQAIRRCTLVPKAAIVATIVIAALVVGAVVVGALVARARLVRVPDVVGMTSERADAVLTAAGFRVEMGGARVSPSVPAGDVLVQDPEPSTEIASGGTVSLVVSAGPQTVIVPDLIGRTADAAEKILVSMGLKVDRVAVSSETTPGVVLEIFPAPGASVSVGDELRLSVSGEPSTSDVLLPYDLKGVSVLLDPQPVPGTMTTDAPMEIARRLRALLEAAGASVATTRPTADTATTPTARTNAAQGSGATLFVGIDLGTSGASGVRVLTLPASAGADRESESRTYASAITRAANLPGLVLNEPAPTNDPVLAAFRGPGVRVVVGDVAAETDRARFGDPAWADQLARAIYRGIGTTLAAK